MSDCFVFPVMRKFILLSISAFAMQAQPVIPETPAGKTLSKWLEVFNRGDRAEMKQYLETYNPERLAGLDGAMEFRKNTGGFHLFSVSNAEPRQIEAIVREREGEGNYAKLTMKVADGDPARITELGIRVTGPPADAPVSARLGVEEAAAGWQAEIAKQAAADNFSGAYLWAKNGKVIASGAVGMADRGRKVANTLDTSFRIGSMNKMFTSTATFCERSNDYVKLHGKRGLEFEPGEKSVYLNYGFLLLGLVIEKVSGASYCDYFRQHIFRPAGMSNTDSQPEQELVSNRSVGYMKENGQWASNSNTLPWRGTPAGGGYSTGRR